jgi:uncharacterized protein YbgA (DUF1722 family)
VGVAHFSQAEQQAFGKVVIDDRRFREFVSFMTTYAANLTVALESCEERTRLDRLIVKITSGPSEAHLD